MRIDDSAHLEPSLHSMLIGLRSIPGNRAAILPAHGAGLALEPAGIRPPRSASLIFVLILTWALIATVNVLTRRLTGIAEARTPRGLARASQIRTVAAVIRATAIAIIGFLASLQILRDVFNFNLAPLLTSAGVAGVAIGLAAQTIVKDCLNGMLILIEDQYNVGDAVRLAGLSGTVESMSLRTTMLRDGDGTLYTIPNSQITSVANLTRDYSVATINVSVDFSADPDKGHDRPSGCGDERAQRSRLSRHLSRRPEAARRRLRSRARR